MLADPNEVHAWVRATQDAGALDMLIQLANERIALMQTPKVSAQDKRRGLVAPKPTQYVHEQQHCQGGSLQPVMTGPSPATIYSTSTAEQAMINSALLEVQTEEGRHPAQTPAAVNITAGETSEGYQPSEDAVRKASESGGDPLAAASAARAGQAGMGQGVLPAATGGEGAGAGEGAAGDGGKGGGKGGEKTPSARGTHSDKEANPGHSPKK